MFLLCFAFQLRLFHPGSVVWFALFRARFCLVSALDLRSPLREGGGISQIICSWLRLFVHTVRLLALSIEKYELAICHKDFFSIKFIHLDTLRLALKLTESTIVFAVLD